MKLSEFLEKVKSLVGDDDADIYLDISEGESGFKPDFNIYLDSDNDLNIRF